MNQSQWKRRAIPSKEWADSSKTPKPEHIKESIVPEFWRQNLASKLWWNRRGNIQKKPATSVPPSNLFWAVYEKISCSIQIGHKEGQDNINCKESIDNIICSSKSSLWLLNKPKFKWRYPSRIDDQKNQKSLPRPTYKTSTQITCTSAQNWCSAQS